MNTPELTIDTDSGKWKLVRKWEHKGTIVPKGFLTDLDSVPRIPYIYSWFKGYAKASAILHDWLYVTGEVSRRKADKKFYRCMREEGVSRWRALFIFWAVRLFGWIGYDPNPNSLMYLFQSSDRQGGS